VRGWFDQHVGTIGSACRKNKVFHNGWDIGLYEVCGNNKFANAAKFITNDSKFHKANVWKINVTVPCEADAS